MLKMKELILKSNESKSTILYYVKEGLLPQPNKIKANVHEYDTSCIEILKFIKYLKINFSYTINDIKELFTNNNINFDGSLSNMIQSLELISIGKDTTKYTKDEFLDIVGISSTQLEDYIRKSYLLINNEEYTNREIQIVNILNQAKDLKLDFSLFDQYVEHAKTLSKIESEIAIDLLNNKNNDKYNNYELLFNLVLKVKPYIFNKHTINEYKKNKDK